MYSFRCDKETAIVQTVHGKIRGYWQKDVYIFKGIPYARAERFEAPVPLDDWEGVRDCTGFGYCAPFLEFPVPSGELLVAHRYWPMDENCQNLNLWTPGLDDAKRPVLVWLHGGGYESGSAIEHQAYEGENMARIGDVVSVSVNHRLNVLGYMDLSDFGERFANSGNCGGDDLVAALRWIHENVAQFGGDPDNVTIFGQSGGGGKVTTLLQTPAADGLYAKAFNMSGIFKSDDNIPALHPELQGSGREMGEHLMAECGVGTIEELQRVPFYFLAQAYRKWKPILFAEGKNCGDSPYANGYYVGDPFDIGFRKETAGVPMLIGSVYSEFPSFTESAFDKHTLSEEEQTRMLADTLGEDNAAALIPLMRQAYPDRPIIDLLQIDIMFRPAIIEYVKLRAAVNPETYVYLFNHDMAIDGGRAPWHCSDIPYVFHNTAMVQTTQDAYVDALEKDMFEMLMTFARTGRPGHSGIPSWPGCTPNTENTMVIDGPGWKIRPNHDHELLKRYAPVYAPIFAATREQTMEKAQH